MTERDRHFRGDILIENGKIAGIGSIDRMADETIDASKMLALPSFVNAHTHSPMVLMRNYKDTCEELMSWLSEIFPIEDKLQDDDIYWGSKLAIAELIQSGCTTFADMYFQSWNTAKAVRETGARAVLGLTLFGDGEETKRHRESRQRSGTVTESALMLLHMPYIPVQQRHTPWLLNGQLRIPGII